MKTFIAISSVIENNKLVYLTTSKGRNLFNENGISTFQAIEFLHSLLTYRHHKSNVVFICYAFSRDNEFTFSLLPPELKDKLFQSIKIKNEKEVLQLELDAIKAEYYTTRDKEKQDLLDFESYVNELNIKELETVDYQGYNLTLANGKFLTIRKKGKSITIYDVYKFFNKPLYNAVNSWLNKDCSFLNLKYDNARLQNERLEKLFRNETEFRKAKAELETGLICELTDKLNKCLLENGFSLSKFHGCGALSSNILNRIKAKNEFHSYQSAHQTSNECYKASQQAFYGARIEQFKIGSLSNINVYDINSAYAYACLFLPKMLRKPIFVKEFNNEPFSWWFIDYDFTSINPYFGFLPNRDKRFSFIQYKLKGRGYYYKPEIDFLLEHYPECITIKQGFYVPFEMANWTKEILAIYEIRKALKKQNNPLEKVLKLALAGIYGKFCQRQGRGYYYNFYYAGFITAKVRQILLQVVHGREKNTVCFLTDAIHTNTNLDVTVSDNIGDFSLKQYEQGQYFNAGVYCLTDKDGNQKKAHQGFNSFDFEAAKLEIKERKTFTALQELFTGWNVFSENRFGLHNYLEYHKQNKQTNPFETYARVFDALDIDLSESYIDSKIVKLYGGIESGIYKSSNRNRTSDYSLDSIKAKRL